MNCWKAKIKYYKFGTIRIFIYPYRYRVCNFELMTASLDRIDSLKGYEPNNVQWVHKHINKMKNNFQESYFINMCQLIINHANQQGS